MSQYRVNLKERYFEISEDGARYALTKALASEANRPALAAWKRSSGPIRQKAEKLAIAEEKTILCDDLVAKGVIKPIDQDLKVSETSDNFWYALRNDVKLLLAVKQAMRNQDWDLISILKRFKLRPTIRPVKDDLVVLLRDTITKHATYVGRFVEVNAAGSYIMRSMYKYGHGTYAHPVEMTDIKCGDYFTCYTDRPQEEETSPLSAPAPAAATTASTSTPAAAAAAAPVDAAAAAAADEKKKAKNAKRRAKQKAKKAAAAAAGAAGAAAAADVEDEDGEGDAE